MTNIHPVLPLLIAALVIPLLGIAGRRAATLIGSILALGLVLLLPDGVRVGTEILGQELTLLRSDALGRIFALAFAAYAVIASVYAWSETGRAAKAFSMSLAAGGVGVSLAGDWFTLFLFWEMLTVSSLFLIWQGRTPEALDAGFRYLLLHLGGGVCLLTGILLQWQGSGSLAFEALPSLMENPFGWLILIGMLINAAAPPLHAWLPDAYPRATVFGTVFLSAFTTKAAVYALARAFPGTDPLVWLGAGMTLYGAFFAVLENDMRRLLGYHIVSQVGYMICGIGLGSSLALNGTAAHAFSHIFYKGLLLMSVGAVVHAAGTGKLSELGGLARPLRWVLFFMLIGAFSIAGVPLFNGFVSKALVVSAAAYENRPAIELILLIASMGTFLSIGLKMPWLAFGPREDGFSASPARPVPRSMFLAMGAAALVCLVTGLFPNLLYARLPHAMHYAPYTADHVVGGLQILVATALVFWLLRRLLAGRATVTLDVDRLYRRPIFVAIRSAGGLLQDGGKWFADNVTGQILAWGVAWRQLPRRAAMTLSGQSWVFLVALLGLAFALLVGT